MPYNFNLDPRCIDKIGVVLFSPVFSFLCVKCKFAKGNVESDIVQKMHMQVSHGYNSVILLCPGLIPT